MVNGQRFRLVTNMHGPTHLVEVDGVAHRISRDEGGVVRAPAPALVVATPLDAGAEVAAGAPVLVLESMKMETVLRAPFRARLRECLVAVGSLVETGAPLLRLEPLGNGGGAARRGRTPPTSRSTCPPSPPACPRPSGSRAGLRDLRGLLLGFDTGPHNGHRVLDGYLAARAAAGPGDGHGRLAGEIELLEVFADLSELTRNRPAGPDARTDTQVHSPREYFHAYLQSLDAERAGLPEAFQHRLSQVLGHYGVTSLERTPELEDAVFRIFLAQRRAASDAAVVTALLRQWLTEPPPGEPLRERAGLTLEHLIAATQLRFPAVADLARSVVFRWFAQPLLRRNRALVYAAVRKHLSYLDATPGRAGPRGPDRRDGGQLGAAGAAARAADRPPGRRAGADAGGADPPLLRQQGAARPADPRGGRRARSSPPGTRTRPAGPPCWPPRWTSRRCRPPCGPSASSPRPATPVADIYLTWAGQPDDPDAMAAELHAVLAAAAAAQPAPPGHHHRGRAQRRGDAPPLHVPAVARRDHRRAADPRPAPADRPADAAGTAAQLRPDPAALGRRGRLPVPLRGAGPTRPTSGWSRWPRCVT